MLRKLLLTALIFCAGWSFGERPQILCTGTMSGAKGAVAVIDGDVYRANDTVAGYQVISITDRGVNVRYLEDGSEHFVMVSSGAALRAETQNDPAATKEGKTKAAKNEPQTQPLGMDKKLLISLSLLGLGMLISTISSIWFLVVSFKESVWWGLGCLFIPLIPLIFLIKYWYEAKRPFGLMVLGNLLIFGAVFMAPEFFEQYSACYSY